MTTTLTSANFWPSGIASLALLTQTPDARSFVRVAPLTVSTLPTDAQSIIAAALSWLGSQLGDGYQWSEIALRKIPNGIPAVMSEIGDDDDPETWEPVEITPAQDDIVAAIYGEHPELGQSVISQGTLHLPDTLRIGLLAVWAGVENGITPQEP